MMRTHRQRHRRMIGFLAGLLPIVFAASVIARRPVPVSKSPAPGLSPQPAEYGSIVFTKTDLWPGHPFVTHLRRDAAGLIAVEFQFREFARPDVLAYWVAGHDSPTDRLADNARLLGAFLPRTPLAIPAAARGEPGRFVLYSLADHEIVARSRPFVLQPN